MRKPILAFLGFLLLLPLRARTAWGLGLDDFRQQVFQPDNLPAPSAGDISAEGRVIEVLQFLTNLLLYASGSVAVLILVIGGVMYVTSLGKDDQVDQAKKLIQYAIMGLLAVILAYAAVTNIIDLIFRATN